MILKVMTEDGYSIYPGVSRVDFFSASNPNPRCWVVAHPEDDPFGDVIFCRKGETDELVPNPVNFSHLTIPEKGKRSICILSGEYKFGSGDEVRFLSWAFHEAYLMDDAGRTIEHLF